MINFEALINAAIADGYSKENLAEMFTDALNTAKEPDVLGDWFEKMYDETAGNDIADTCVVLTELISNEHKDWDVEDLKNVYDNIKNNVDSIVQVIEDFKSGEAPMDILNKTIKETCEKFDIEKVIGDFLKSLG